MQYVTSSTITYSHTVHVVLTPLIQTAVNLFIGRLLYRPNTLDINCVDTQREQKDKAKRKDGILKTQFGVSYHQYTFLITIHTHTIHSKKKKKRFCC